LDLEGRGRGEVGEGEKKKELIHSDSGVKMGAGGKVLALEEKDFARRPTTFLATSRCTWVGI
jgi:hypothetical protein